MGWLIGFLVLFAFAVISLVVRARKAGPRQVSDALLDRGRPIVRCTTEDPGDGWSELGSRTTADGLKLRFDADDDPQAEARLLAPNHERAGNNRFGHSRVITLGNEYATEHVHTSGYAFRVRLRGTGATVGKQVEIKMLVGSNGAPCAGLIENDDDHDPAMGDWIEFEFAEILKLPPGAR